MTTLKELQEQRGQLAVEIRALADKQESWTAEDREQWDGINERYNGVMEDIEKHNLAAEIEERKNLLSTDDERMAGGFQTRSVQRSGADRIFSPKLAAPTMEQRCLALQAWMCDANDLEVRQQNIEAAKACGLDYRSSTLEVRIDLRSPMSGFELFSVQNGKLDWNAFDERVKRTREFEGRQMNTTTPTEGAEWVPTLFQYELERAMMAYGGFRRIARLLPTAGGNPLEWPTVNDLANKAVIVGENQDVGAHTAPTTGQIIFGGYKYSSLPVLVSEELIQDSAFNISALMGSLLGERIGRGQAEHLAVGDGATQPEGVTVGGTVGKTAAAATTIDADELIDLQGSLDPAYEALPSTGWAMNKNTLTAIRKLKTTDDQYLWQPGLRLGQPDLLLGSSYAMIQEMPDLAASAKPIAYGAFEKFVIRDIATVRFYRLVELYRQNDQTGFLALHRMDSKVIQALAIKLLEMAAA